MANIEESFAGVLDMLVPLNQLSLQRRAQVLNRAEVLSFRRGDYVFREGERDPYTFFLLDGQLELYAGQQLFKSMRGGEPGAEHALAQLQPRQLTARALGKVSVLRVDRVLLEKLLALETTPADEIAEPEPEEESDWMTLMLQSALFARVPAANIQRVFSSLQPVKYQAGDIVIRQGEPGDFYYVIQSGRCEVERQIRGGKVPVKLAELRPGDSFGEEALVADATRNATVRMLSPGVLMRLTKADFVELIKKPLLNVLTLKEAQERVASRGAVWLDVRFPDERRQGFFEGSINIPLSALRLQAGKLPRATPYIVYCDTGSRSAVGAFLLSERGFDVHYLAGGTNRYALFRATPERQGRNVPELEIQAPDPGGPTVVPMSSAPLPASQQTEAERRTAGIAELPATGEALQADLRAQALKADLAKAGVQLDEARRLKERTERAREEARCRPSERGSPASPRTPVGRWTRRSA